MHVCTCVALECRRFRSQVQPLRCDFQQFGLLRVHVEIELIQQLEAILLYQVSFNGQD